MEFEETPLYKPSSYAVACSDSEVNSNFGRLGEFRDEERLFGGYIDSVL